MLLNVYHNCPICLDGQVGFRKCQNDPTLILMCDECDSVWLDPEEINSETVIYPASPDFLIPELKCSTINSRWATDAEIENMGWTEYIAGEGIAMDQS